MNWLVLLWVVLGFAGGTLARLLAILGGPSAEDLHDEGNLDDAAEEATDPPHPPVSTSQVALARADVATTAQSASGRANLRCPFCGRSVLRPGALWPAWLTGELDSRDAAGFPECDGCQTAARAFLLAECAGAAVFGALATRFAGPTLLIYSFATVVLLTLFLTDVAYRLIPNRILYPATLMVATATIALRGPATPLAGVAICGGFFLLIYVIGLLLSSTVFKGRLVFGMGDVKLAFFVGLLVGWPAAPTAVTLIVLAGCGLAVLWIVRGQHRVALPYGTALAIGAVLTLFVDPRVA